MGFVEEVSKSQSHIFIILTMGLLTILTSLARSDVLTFDDITTAPSQRAITGPGAGGFSWINFGVVNGFEFPQPGTGYSNGAVSGEYVAVIFNPSVYTGRVFRQDAELFDFNGAYLTAAFFNDLNIQIEGLLNGALLYSQTVVVDTDVPTWFDFNFLGVDELQIISFGGTDAGLCPIPPGLCSPDRQIAMDNFTFSICKERESDLIPLSFASGLPDGLMPGCGIITEDILLNELEDDSGNKIQTWSINFDPPIADEYRAYYIPIGGNPALIGRCPFKHGDNEGSIYYNGDYNGNGIPDCFVYTYWISKDQQRGDEDDDGDGKIDWWVYRYYTCCERKLIRENWEFSSPPVLAYFDTLFVPTLDDPPPVPQGLIGDVSPMTWDSIPPCDINSDGICDLVDLTIFTNALGTIRGDVEYHPKADIDGDGIVTDRDQDLLFPEGLTMTVDLSISEGWNMIGLPLNGSDNGYQILFPNAIENTFYSFNGSYQPDTVLTIGEGYWLRFSGDEIVSIEGTKIDSVTIDLEQGWNLIAGVSADVELTSVDDPGGIIIPGTLYEFAGSYVPSDSIKQGKGYWIRTNTTGQITISASTGPGSVLVKSNTLLDLSEYPILYIMDAKGFEHNLYLNVEMETLEDRLSYELPPIPPNGSFDVRFADGYRINESDESVIDLQTSNFPITVTLSGLTAEEGYQYVLKEMMNGQEGETHVLSEEKTSQITNSEVNKLILSKEKIIPREFVVSQSYPNPFNPTATIKYALPWKTYVVIEVFNVLGQKVAILVNEEKTAGYHKVDWNGKNQSGKDVASGLFFYRIKADKFVRTKKMILLR